MVGTYVLIYVLLNIPSIQRKVVDFSIEALREKIHSDVSIGSGSFELFNRFVLKDVLIKDRQGDTLLYVNRLGANIELFSLLRRELTINTVQLYNFEVRMRKETPDAPINFQYIIDAFKSDKKKKESPLDNFTLKALLIRKGKLTYDVGSAPRKEAGFDVNHIAVNNLQMNVSVNTFRKDSLDAQISRFSLSEQSGFRLHRLSLHLTANAQHADISKFRVLLPNGAINFRNIYADYSNLVENGVFNPNNLLFNVEIAPSRFYVPEVSTFAPFLKEYKHYAQLELSAGGSLNAIRLRHLSLQVDQQMEVIANGELSNFYKNTDPAIDLSVERLALNSSSIIELLTKNTKIKSGSLYPLAKLGNVGFVGHMTGSLRDFKAEGHLRTNAGTVETSLHSLYDPRRKNRSITGTLNTSILKTEGLFPAIPLKQVRSQGRFSLQFGAGGIKKVDADMNLSQVIYSGSTYDHVVIDGSYTPQSIEGSLTMDGVNEGLSLKTAIHNLKSDLHSSQSSYWVDLNVRNFNITPFFPRLNKPMLVSLTTHVDLKGDLLDGAIGDVGLNDLTINYGTESWGMDHFLMQSTQQGDIKNLTIESPILNGRVVGSYQFASLAKDFERTIARYVPALFEFESPQEYSKRQLEAMKNNDIRFAFQLENTRSIARTFNLPISTTEPLKIEGSFSNYTNDLLLDVNIPQLKVKANQFENISLFLTNLGTENLSLQAKADIPLAKDAYHLEVTAQALDNSISSQIQWKNSSQKMPFQGELGLVGEIRRSLLNKVEGTVHIQPSEFMIQDSIWHISEAEVDYQNPKIAISNLFISGNSQSLSIDGVVSASEEDSLLVDLKNVSLDYIFEIVNVNNFSLGGSATGLIEARSLLATPRMRANPLRVKSFSVNKSEVGDFQLISEWEQDIQGILLKGDINRDGYRTNANGHIFPTKDSLDIQFKADHLKTDFLAPYIGSILKNQTGFASGRARLFGKFSSLNLEGAVRFDEIKFGIDFINTHYTVTDSIFFAKDRIWMTDVKVSDRLGNQGILSGEITHRGMKDFRYNLQVQSQGMNVFEVPQTPKGLYYGSIFANGSVHIYGDERTVNIDVNARPINSSRFTLQLQNSRQANDYSFIRFVDSAPNANADSLGAITIKTPVQGKDVPKSNLFVNMIMDVTPDLSLGMVLDPNSGDELKGVGSGTVTLNYNSLDNEIKLYGSYYIDRGSYGFRFQNVFSRDFIISSGSSVTLRGDPLQSILDIKAAYNLTANLTDLNQSFSDVSRATVPVQCLLGIKGTLDNLTLGFDLNLPNNSEDVNRRVKNAIGSEDMMNRQVIYLMLLGRFYTIDYATNPTNSGEFTSAMVSSTVSALIGNVFSQIAPNVKIGANYRLNSLGNFQDAEVALSSQLLDNRLLFNGNFGYREDIKQQSSFIGDFEFEYLLNRSGSLSAKAYNKTNEKNYYIKSSLTTQGIGLSFKKSFSSVKDLFKPERSDTTKHKKKKKDESTTGK